METFFIFFLMGFNFPWFSRETNRESDERKRTWGSRERTISALENLSVRRIMKQPRASSQWKLPLCVPTRFRGAWLGEPAEEKAETLVAMRGSRRVVNWVWKVKSLWFKPLVMVCASIAAA